ncbi:hypothetical protein K5X82_00990 [Halosquirtibacter xylanolyticus]|uniref:hypothetical protein n=1 Tax=Halosquirtibacter xylanolyticus TaxID=3374599 RepID=UPI0037490F74|nr:hypothetical protein K5X82_00990 [Prolixibacteraceae bacterium]
MATVITYDKKEKCLYSDQDKKTLAELDHDGILFESNQTILHLFASNHNRKNRCFLIFPGGAYRKLSMNTEGVEIARDICLHGDDAIIVQYCLPYGDIRDSLASIYYALHKLWLSPIGKKIDWNNMHIIGFSAGGHLAGLISNLVNFPFDHHSLWFNLKSLCLGYPVVSMIESFKDEGCLAKIGSDWNIQENIKLYSLECLISSNTVPSFIIYARDDQRISPKHSVLYLDKLLEFSVYHEKFILDIGGHGFGKGDGLKDNWFCHYLKWINTL